MEVGMDRVAPGADCDMRRLGLLPASVKGAPAETISQAPVASLQTEKGYDTVQASCGLKMVPSSSLA